eukprot:TRINITY_DN67775_c15_g2_i1.p1 TRINITY_DN67775_c15_g2~~TRINITY_DN67775_c15_g2_i1.p1  ORF type:complete len:150 (+),score=6.02 TRINITY_DN67775_c15_g2_i1:114-563(+)
MYVHERFPKRFLAPQEPLQALLYMYMSHLCKTVLIPCWTNVKKLSPSWRLPLQGQARQVVALTKKKRLAHSHFAKQPTYRTGWGHNPSNSSVTVDVKILSQIEFQINTWNRIRASWESSRTTIRTPTGLVEIPRSEEETGESNLLVQGT